MKERPILFSSPMVRAILAGTKTQTRRIMKPQPGPCDHAPWPGRGPDWLPDEDGWHCGVCGNGVRLAHTKSGVRGVRCPYGARGDRLWVRETYGIMHRVDSTPGGQPYDPLLRYRATNPDYVPEAPKEVLFEWKWRPSIHMPRWASRITLEVTNVRVERLRDITEDDAKAEGVDSVPVADVPRNGTLCKRDDFAQLWNIINGDRAPWESNPWVWVVEFKRLPTTDSEAK